MKVYIVQLDRGSWDEHGVYIEKIFQYKEEAELYTEKRNKEISFKKSMACMEAQDDNKCFMTEYEVE